MYNLATLRLLSQLQFFSRSFYESEFRDGNVEVRFSKHFHFSKAFWLGFLITGLSRPVDEDIEDDSLSSASMFFSGHSALLPFFLFPILINFRGRWDIWRRHLGLPDGFFLFLAGDKLLQ